MKKSVFFLRRGLWTLLSFFFVSIIGLCFFYLYLESELPDVDFLNNVPLQVPLRIYTQDGKLIQEYGEKKLIPVTYKEIPQPLINALIATEDQRFFEHSGVDILGLGRAAVTLIKTGTKSQGGSTITMQVARNFFLSRKKTFLRKFNEILLAIKIDRELSKEKILELYLNRVYLGNRAYGVGAAANVYYGKPLQALSLAELAMIAGLPQAPSTQNPLVNPIAAMKRRDHVLLRLLEEKYISKESYQQAIKEPLTAKYYGSNIEVSAPYVAETIRQSLYDHFGPEAYTKGYKVYTTIDSKEQLAANEVIAKHLIAYDKRHGYRGPVTNFGPVSNTKEIHLVEKLSHYPKLYQLEPAIIVSVSQKQAAALNSHGELINIQWPGLAWARPSLKTGGLGKSPSEAKQVVTTGDLVYIFEEKGQWQLSQVPEAEAALIALNPKNGAIEALVGGFNFQKSKFNRVTQSSRQPGSSFKPFIYAAALNKGYTLATLINDAPIVVDDPSQPTLWRPHNVNMKFNGPTRLKEALVHSQNMVSIRILDDLGFDYAIEFLTQFGFEKKQIPKALSLALGTLSLSPMDLTAAYAVFANGGYKIEPYLIDHISTNEGKILLEATPTLATEALLDNQSSKHATLAPRVLPKDIAFLMYSALQEVIRKGTAHAASVLKRPDIAGKTGTTNDQVDAWFAGFNQDLVATVWVGYDNPQSLHEYAANLALPIWIDFMRVALENKPKNLPEKPDNIISLKIDPATGMKAKENQSNAITEYFRKQDVPAEDDSSLPTYFQEDEHSGEESLF